MSAPASSKANELELSIASHGRDMISAYEAGDRESALRFQGAMYSAIAQRAPASQAKRFAEIDRAIAGGDGCYFMDAGDRDRARLGAAR